ncbi:hypothetical protein ACFLZB_02305 [Nanoarchaeota archaeon]
MDKMLSINKAVEELLKNRPFINDSFRLGIVNYSGLARYLEPLLKEKLDKKINSEAVIMAVKRYGEKVSGEAVSSQVLNVLANCDLRLKGDVVELTLEKTTSNYQIALDVYKKINWQRGDIVNVYQSLTEIAVLLEDKNKDLILKKCTPVHMEEDLAIVTLKTPEEMLDVPGFIYHLLGLIGSAGVNIVDVISTYTELNLIVKEKDAAKVYDLLFDSIKKARKS